MWFRYLFLITFCLALTACSNKTGYEVLHQVSYQECLRRSPHPLEECAEAPPYEVYQQELQRKSE